MSSWPDPRIQPDPQQFALWGQLHEQIVPVLAEELQRGLAESAGVRDDVIT